MNPAILQAVESSRECASVCKACAASMQGDKQLEHCTSVCIDCATICELFVGLGEKNSPFFRRTANLVMEACDHCAQLCERTPHELCIKCAWQCRKCMLDLSNISPE